MERSNLSVTALTQPLKRDEAWHINKDGKLTRQARTVADRVFADSFTYDVLRVTYAELNAVRAAHREWRVEKDVDGTVTLLGLEILELSEQERDQLMQAIGRMLQSQGVSSIASMLRAGETLGIGEDGSITAEPGGPRPAPAYRDAFTGLVLKRTLARIRGAKPGIEPKGGLGINQVAESLLRQYENLGYYQQKQFVRTVEEVELVDPSDLANRQADAFDALIDCVREHPELKWNLEGVNSIRELEAQVEVPVFSALAHAKEAPELLGLLIEAGADLEAPDSRGAPALYVAAHLYAQKMLSEESLMTLIRGGADPNGHPAAVGASNALTFLLKPSDERVARELIKAGADPNICTEDGQSLMGRLAKGKQLAAVRRLAALGGHYSPSELRELVTQAATLKEASESIAFLEDHGVDIFEEDGHGNGLLHMIANVGPLQLALALIDMGLDINRQNASGDTPLHIAAAATREVTRRVSGGRPRPTLYEPVWNVDMVRELAKQGAKMELQNKRGASVWHVLLEQSGRNRSSDEKALVELLREACLPLYAQTTDNAGRNLLHIALRNSDIENFFPIVDALVSKGVSVNALDESGRSALHYTLMRYGIDLADVLSILAYGADPTIKSGLAASATGREDQSPRELAEQMELAARRQLRNLIQHGSPELALKAREDYHRLLKIRLALGGKCIDELSEDPEQSILSKEEAVRQELLNFIGELETMAQRGFVKNIGGLHDRGRKLVDTWVEIVSMVPEFELTIDVTNMEWPPTVLEELRNKSQNPMINMLISLLLGQMGSSEE